MIFLMKNIGIFCAIACLTAPTLTVAQRLPLDIDATLRIDLRPSVNTPVPSQSASTPAVLGAHSGAPTSMYMPHAKLGADWKPQEPPDPERPMVPAPQP